MRVGRIPYINCYPVYGAIDRGLVPFHGELVTGIPTVLNRRMAERTLDISVVSAVEYARDSLGVDYIFWGMQEPYYSNDVVSTVAHYVPRH